MTSDHRAPQAFILPDEDEKKAGKTTVKSRSPQPKIVFEEEPLDRALVTVPTTSPARAPRRFRWLAILMSSLLALVGMWASLSIVQLVEGFFARSPALGWIAMTVAIIAAVAASAIVLREIVGLFRLAKLEKLQEAAARAINLDEKSSADSACASLVALYQGRPDTALGLKSFANHRNDILDPRDRMKLADRLLVAPLDEAANKIIASRARRVTLLTTVTPAAALDILFVAAQNFSMLREVASLYGGRPSTLATLKLARMVASHLAITGGLALSDNLIQHLVGRGLLGRLSARFGEGAVNGILTARIGLAATNVCRPIPREGATSDTLASLLKQVVSFGEKPTKDTKDDAD
jgi:putative membrane protein